MNLQRVRHSTGWSWADEICLQWVVVVVVERWQVDFLFQNLWSFIHWSDRRINSGRFGRRFGDTAAQDIISCAFHFKCRLDWCIRGRFYCRATIAIRLARHFIMTIIIENILAFCPTACTLYSSWPRRLHIVVVVVSSHHHPILSCSHELDSPFRTSYVAVTVPIWSKSLINCIPVCVSIHSRIQLMTQRGSTNNNVTLLFHSTRSTSITLES